MGLSLVIGPAHAGEVALLLERYGSALDHPCAGAESASEDSARAKPGDPWLVVPNRVDVDRVERDLIRRRPALLAGTIGTFDDLFRHVAKAGVDDVPEASETQRALAVRRAVARLELDDLGRSATTSGFADTALATIGELESALLDVDELEGDLSQLVHAYREELSKLGRRDRDGLRRAAVERLRGDLEAWSGAPVFAYGFEDLTGAEWALVEALAARTDVTVSIPYEPSRAAFAALERTVGDLAELSRGAIEEPPRSSSPSIPAALGHLERELFVDEPTGEAPLDGAVRFLEGAGTRGTAELVASEVAALVRGGTSGERIAVVCESADRWRAPLESALGELHVPFAFEHARRLGETPLGRALIALLRFEWRGGTRGDLFAFLRSPFSGIERRSVDFVEGRLRGRAVSDPARVEEESEKLRGAPVPALVELRATADPAAAALSLLRSLVRNAWGLEAPPIVEEARLDARAFRAAERALDDVRTLADDTAPSREEVLGALERVSLAPEGPATGRVAILDHERARTRSFDAVFVLGL